MTKLYNITYLVKYETTISVEDGKDLEDVIDDMEIPKLEFHYYVDDSFKVVNKELV